MQHYKQVEVSEAQLEELVRRGADLIEDGLKFVDHQRHTDRGRLDVLLVDSGKALVVAELKIIEDDSMLLQGLDYYDYVSTNIEAYARLYENFEIIPTQGMRLVLIAPSFSQTLINRCKWIDASISLFTYKAIQFDKSDDITPVFTEVSIPAQPEPVEERYTVEDRLAYITDIDVREIASQFLKDVMQWKKDKILIEAIKYSISSKVNNRVFMYLSPRRRAFVVETFNSEGKWTGFTVNTKDDLDNVIGLVKTNVEKKSQ